MPGSSLSPCAVPLAPPSIREDPLHLQHPISPVGAPLATITLERPPLGLTSQETPPSAPGPSRLSCLPPCGTLGAALVPSATSEPGSQLPCSDSCFFSTSLLCRPGALAARRSNAVRFWVSREELNRRRGSLAPPLPWRSRASMGGGPPQRRKRGFREVRTPDFPHGPPRRPGDGQGSEASGSASGFPSPTRLSWRADAAADGDRGRLAHGARQRPRPACPSRSLTLHVPCARVRVFLVGWSWALPPASPMQRSAREPAPRWAP